MECPYCEQELKYHDFYFAGNYAAYEKGLAQIQKKGDIYKCENEGCESSVFNSLFHTREGNDELKEGNPV